MTKEEKLKKIREDEDFINFPKCNNSLAEFLKGNPDGAENKEIAKALMVTEEEVEDIYQECVDILKERVGVDE